MKAGIFIYYHRDSWLKRILEKETHEEFEETW